LIGWFADAVTVHTLTQKSNAAHGGQLTSVDLAIAPKTEHFDERHRSIVGEICRKHDVSLSSVRIWKWFTSSFP